MTDLWFRLLASCWLMCGAMAVSPLQKIPAVTTTPTTTTAAPPSPDMTHWVSFSTVIRPGSNLTIRACITNATGPVTLQLDLMDYNGNLLQDGQNITLQANGNVETEYFQIASTLKREWNMYLRARASGGLEFDGFEQVTWDNKRLSVFIQTDKAVYKPGQSVRFRALVMQPDTKVAYEPMDIVITDPSNNMITQRKGVKGGDAGVFQGEMVTSQHPPLGIWKIKANVDGQIEEKTFELKEYELPRFEVKVTFPSYALVTDENVVGMVSAKYTFGSPIQGPGSIVAKASYYRPAPFSITKTFELNGNGEANVSFSYTELFDLGYKTVSYRLSYYKKEYFSITNLDFNFNAEVKDNLTDDVMKGDTSLKFYTSPLNLKFTRRSPPSFKSGLPYIAFVEATQPDGKPLANPTTVSVNFNVSYRSYGSYVQESLPSQVEKLDPDGMAKIKINSLPENVTSLLIRATALGDSTFKSVVRFNSPSNVFLQLRLKTTTLKVNKRVDIELKSNVKFGTFTMQVYSKGDLVLTKKEVRSGLRKERETSFRLTSAMAPVADVVVFFEAEDGEVVVDRVVVGVEEYSANDVKLNFKAAEVKPGQSVKLKVQAQPGSHVFLLGVDKSVKLLGTGNDITRDDVMSELIKYGSKNVFWSRQSWYYFNFVNDADDVLKGARAGMITDGVIPGKRMDNVPKPFQKQSKSMMVKLVRVNAARQPVAMAVRAPAGDVSKSSSAEKDETPAEQLRKFFPETWLWDYVHLRGKKWEMLDLTAPDTITSWEVTAFAVHAGMGLAVTRVPAKLVTIKKLFVTVDLPYSAVRGEDVCFKALIFNRYPKPVKVTVFLDKNGTAFHNIVIRSNRKNPSERIEVRKSFRAKKRLGMMKPNSVVSTTFCITPRALGDIPVKVYLKASRPSDGLVRTIRIKPEGVERSQSYPLLIEITSTQQFSDTVKIDLPDRLVPGSLRMRVTLVGDVLGIVAHNMEDLLRMPYGCGEQNLIHFAPNTYLISYLRKTGRLTTAILTKATNFMLTGYQQQLNYQHPNGAFSAFGSRDPSGSMWLTAFVVKCFVQAVALGSDIVPIEPKVITKAISWILDNQNSNGTFNEPGRVIHRAMQGGSARGLALTGFVTITLTDARNVLSLNMTATLKNKVNLAINRSVSYLESQMSSVGQNDSYEACLIAYALTLAASSKADDAIIAMNNLAKTAGLLKYWSGPVEIKQTYYSWYKKTDSLSIEMTSYALLTLMLKGYSNDAVLVFRWLNKQRGPKGGFVSTQDTVVGLQALAAMSHLALGANFSPIQVTVTWNSGGSQSKSMTINKDNVMLLQKLDIPLPNGQYPDEVTISATSSVSGNQSVFALGEVVTYYYVDNQTSPQVFNINTTVINNTATSFVLKTCVSLQANTTSRPDSMTVAEIKLPSGYRIVRSRSDFGNMQRKDIYKGKAVLYYYTLDSTGECSLLNMRMTNGMVANIKPCSINVYDYYKPYDEFTTYYSLAKYGACSYMDCSE